jgi:hypothetical protein
MRSADDALSGLRVEEHEALARDGEHDVRAVLDAVLNMLLRVHRRVADAEMDDLFVSDDPVKARLGVARGGG